ncbi:hypothetical protein TNCV_2762201 [Trichonephila clavipes]|nr:hypothetical protein TNCV_2762201 [Trichonephila clavipes]
MLELEHLCSDFAGHIRKAAKHRISKGNYKDNWIQFCKDYNMEEQIHVRDAINQEFFRNHSEQLKFKLIKVSHRVEEEISTYKVEKGVEFHDKVDSRMDPFSI